MYDEALSAVRAGERARARDLFTRLLKLRQDNPEYWIWMSAVVETAKERAFCLKEALRIDPDNAAAHRGLMLLGLVPPDPARALPAKLQRRDWQSLMAFPESPEMAAAKAARTPAAFIALAAVVVVGLVAFAIFGMQNQWRRRNVRPIIIIPTMTQAIGEATTPPTTTVIAKGTPLPLEALLKETFTPTPLYFNTPHSVSEAYRIGLRAFQRGEWDEAISYFEQVSALEPEADDIRYYLGESYRQQGDLDQALKIFNEAIEQDGDFAPLYVGRARVELARKPSNFEWAVQDLQEAVRLDPAYGEAYLTLAEAYVQAGQTADALDALDQAEQILPDSPLVSLYRAEAFLAGGDPKNALASARKANRLDPTLLLAYRMIAEAMQAQGDMTESLEPLTTYLHYAHDDAEAYFMMAGAQLAAGDKKGARVSLDNGLRLDKQNAQAYLKRARLWLELDEPEKALEDYRAVLRLDGDSFEASMGVAKALMGLDYPGDAYQQIEESKRLAIEERQQAEWRYWRAQSLEALGEKVIALRDYETLLAFPKGVADESWIADAKRRINALVTKTPTTRPKTNTPAPTLTHTRQPTRTFTPTYTRMPTRTNTATATPIPTRTPSPTTRR